MFRRQFLKQTSITTLGMGIVAAVPMEVLASIRKKILPSDKIGVGLIGCNGMGWSDLTSMLKMSELHCVALCDIDDSVLELRKTELAKIKQSPTIYKDYRKLLENKDVQIVIIAVPDHWHCLMMVDACAAGKHILLEKPASNTIAEAQIMINAAKRNNSIVQVNQWQRSQKHFKDAISLVHSGMLGQIAQTKAWMYNAHSILPSVADSPIPSGVDYQMWLGPAQARPFNPNRFHYNFRWYWDYAGGLMTDWGVHLIDMIILGMKADLPQSVVSMGGHIAYPNDARETPDTQTALYSYNNFQMSWEHTMGRQYGPFGMGHGIAFIGSNGTLILNRNGWEVRPEKEKNTPRMEEITWQNKVDNGLDLHTQNLVEAIKAGNAKILNCPIEAGANTAIHCHMGNIALRTKQVIEITNNNNINFNNKKANKLITPVYANGWKLPS